MNTAPSHFLKPLIAVAGILLSLVLLVGFFTIAPLGEIGRAMKQVNLFWVIAAGLMTLLNLSLRGRRWMLFFKPEYGVTALRATEPVTISLALNGVLPGRLGELARLAVGVQRLKTPAGYTAATILGDRLMDALTLLSLLGLSLALSPAAAVPKSVEFMGIGLSAQRLYLLFRQAALLCLLLAGLIALMLFRRPRRWAISLLGVLPGLSAARAARMAAWLEHTLGGIEALRDPARLPRIVGWSFLIWAPIFLGNYLLTLGMPGLTLGVLQLIVYTTLSVASTSLPSAPGAWGVYEAAGLLALSITGVEAPAPVLAAYVLTSHACQYMLIVLSGAAVAAFRHMRSGPHECGPSVKRDSGP